MIKFSRDKVLLLHQIISQETGGDPNLRDINLLDSALESAFQTFDGKELYPTKEEKAARIPRLLIRKHKKVSKINVFKGREHGTKSKNLILTGTKGADFHISALFLSPRHRQPPYGVFSYPYLYPPEKCIN